MTDHTRATRIDLLHGLFERQALRTPDAIAVRTAAAAMTYGELDARANRAAMRLREAGVCTESVVAVCLPRSIDFVISLLGVLKAGGAFLALDQTQPEHRLRQIVADAQPALSMTASAEGIDGVSLPAIQLDARAASTRGDHGAANAAVDGSSLAYVMYTSGTTGRPKGTLLTHQGLCNYAMALGALSLKPTDVYLGTASPAFSSSIRQSLIPLCFGASVAIPAADDVADPVRLHRFMAAIGVTVVDVVPSYWRMCTRVLAQLPADTRARLLDNRLRLIVSASEPLPAELPRIWRREFQHPATWINGYGHTETTGLVSLFTVDDASLDNTSVIPIGPPLANTSFQVVDDDGHPASAGQSGELYIRGTCLARGYLNRPELDAERFVAGAGASAERAYRTGDVVRVLPEGALEFVGRRDLQVKLNGVRIELLEIEHVLRQHPEIDDAAVTVQGVDDDRQLVAYVVAERGELASAELRAFLSARLPPIMIPGVFTKVTSLPRTASGKIDRTRLNTLAPVPEERVSRADSGLEPEIAAEWRRVLRLPQVDVNANFFELGGESLKAMELIAVLQQRFPTDVPMLALFFEEPTVAALARAIQETSSGAPLAGAEPLH
jgi:amino acid adenylation domain-containing protein